MDYMQYAKMLKILSDPTRLKIIDVLSCEEKCACDILERLEISQPTLSHHMKILCEVGIINCRKDGKWTRYSIAHDIKDNMISFFEHLFSGHEECLCLK